MKLPATMTTNPYALLDVPAIDSPRDNATTESVATRKVFFFDTFPCFFRSRVKCGFQ